MSGFQDRVFAEQQETVAAFKFDEAVARVFPDMIQRSVPGYSMVVSMIGLVADRYARPGTNIYDLGSSLGAVSIAMRHAVSHENCRIIAIDNSEAMTERCEKIIAEDDGGIPVDVLCGDIRETMIENASVAALNFTLQFIPVEDRLDLLKSIRNGLCSGGALILSEKLAFPAQHQTILDTLYYDYKRANGYSELEISQKRTALENVLVPESLDEHRERLIEAGFRHVVPWYQGFNFCSLLAVR
ncbi:carboxy-S-adenosyl-L-methionine synthase CmoA [Sansalvadorimonas sp. 2012CJ34-2]|uniref:Carboxy-S-adenosyl-L-methionine synthase n=1 Tax=Parendozoicomonas callyspongiae TaxID=2942213 RepID=A0ABT0PKR9_9GAMM|nr:carboxy-S-adenosyl-L-methionine synthase CmoA [Sansalvadorimonas sp. 2012CJ34-2]MCL6271992.1 carboxy-S-adenosyl-L-methionine synthase CmoA [Sansalvadorimonas sp. 2012CJ34-2]